MRRVSSILASLACTAAVLGACSNDNSTTGITPITGIAVRSESLTAGHGCGTGDDQVFKYEAIVTRDLGDAGSRDLSYGEVIASGTYDCFADATFANLDTTITSSFRVFIYAFDAKAFATCGSVDLTSSNGCSNPTPDGGLDAGADASVDGSPDASVDGSIDASVEAGADGATEAGPRPTPNVQLGDVLTAAASWTTVCTATQQSSIEVLAVCGPLL